MWKKKRKGLTLGSLLWFRGTFRRWCLFSFYFCTSFFFKFPLLSCTSRGDTAIFHLLNNDFIVVQRVMVGGEYSTGIGRLKECIQLIGHVCWIPESQTRNTTLIIISEMIVTRAKVLLGFFLYGNRKVKPTCLHRVTLGTANVPKLPCSALLFQNVSMQISKTVFHPLVTSRQWVQQVDKHPECRLVVLSPSQSSVNFNSAVQHAKLLA